MSGCATRLHGVDTAVEVGRTASDVMVTVPKTLPMDASVAQVWATFSDDHVHMVLLTADGFLRSTVRRGDLPAAALPTDAALAYGTLVGRTVDPHESAEAIRLRLVGSGQRRLAVVGARGELLGLVCLKRSGTGFCSDEGVAARAAERAAVPDCG
jgi:hypothetical protein